MGTAALAIGAAPASAVTVGQDFTPTGLCSAPPYALVQTAVSSGNSYTVPAAGVLTSFTSSVFDPAGITSIALVVERRVTTVDYLVVGVSAARLLPTVPTAITTPITPIAVRAGDFIGFQLTGPGAPYCYAFAGLDAYAAALGTVTAGNTVTNVNYTPSVRYPISANLIANTTLTAAAATSSYLLSATLRDAAGSGVPGQTITFTTNGRPVCSAVTNASGVATCIPSLNDKLSRGSIVTYGYDAAFAGSTAFVGSSAHGGFGPRATPPVQGKG